MSNLFVFRGNCTFFGKKAKKETTLKMLNKGYSIEDIIDITELSKERIEQIKKELQ